MAYKIIDVVEINNEDNRYITILKYAILERNGSYYLQLKLKNKSEFLIKKMELIYLCDGEEKSYLADNLEVHPDATFMEKTLIPLDSPDFELINIINIKGKRSASAELVEKKEEHVEKQQSYKEKEEKRIEKEKNYNHKKNYHYMYGWSILIIAFSIMVLIGYLSEAVDSSGHIGNGYLYHNKVELIYNIATLVVGIGLFAWATYLTYKAKKNDYYDYSKNPKFVLHCLFILFAFIFVVIMAMLVSQIGFESSPSSSSMNPHAPENIYCSWFNNMFLLLLK